MIVDIPETMPGSGFLGQSEAGAGGARTNGSEGRAAAERREEQAPSPDSTQTRDPGKATFSEKRRKEVGTRSVFVQKSVSCP